MGILSDFKRKKTPMRRKLFLYMLALAVIVLSLLVIGLLLLGNFTSTKETVSKDLSFQSDVFERQIDKYYDDLTMMGVSLSAELSNITKNYLDSEEISFYDLNDNLEYVAGLQKSVFNKLKEELLKTDCSGAFVIFNATVNTTIENAEFSKTGLYFQRSTLDATDNSLLLYRGIADIGRQNNVMPHRKWRLEFRTDLIPNWQTLPQTVSFPIERAVYLSDIAILTGTSEKAMHFIIPVTSADGFNYGYCGFEISESYFKNYFAQATQISHLTCLFTKKQGTEINPENCFSAGVFNGYHLAPKEKLNLKDFGNGLTLFKGGSSYVGRTKEIKLCNGDYLISVMIPKSEYDTTATKTALSMVFLLLVLVSVSVAICVYFSRKFLSPLLKGLEQIRKCEHQNSSSNLVEINDLFVFLTEQDRLREQENDVLRKESEKQQNALNKANGEIQRLSYSRKNEVDPDDYEMFKTGINLLTKTEKNIFKLYLDGKTAEEILQICGIQQSTLKYHNHNILGKLGVSSRKQMLRYATLLKQEQGDL